MINETIKIFLGKIARFFGIKCPYSIYDFFKNQKYFRTKTNFIFAKNFLPYIDNKEYIDKLLNGLDQKNQDFVLKIINNIRLIIYNNYIDYKSIFFNEKDEKISYKKLIEYFKKLNIKFPKEIKSVEYPVLLNHGIDNIPDIYKKVGDKDIIDCGGFIGDSAMMFFKKFGERNNIYVYEPNTNNYEILVKVINLNNVSKYIKAIKKGLGNISGDFYINNKGSASFIGLEGDEKITVTTIDEEVKKLNINPGLIKWDIEGFEYNSILGAKETIIKYKPILIISIYHNGKDFFEIKPLIESWNLGYKFKFEKHNPNDPFFETVLICY